LISIWADLPRPEIRVEDTMNRLEEFRRRIAASPEGKAYRRTRRRIAVAFLTAARFRQNGHTGEADAWDARAEALHERLLRQPWPIAWQNPRAERIVTDQARENMNELVRRLPLAEGPPDARTALKLIGEVPRGGRIALPAL
jgi:hypothetical protein